MIIFTAECGVTTKDELYARIDNGESGARTVNIAEPSKEECKACDTEAPSTPVFEGASEDGSKVFFETEQPLLEGATGWNLYEYDFDAPAGEKVSRIPGGELQSPEQTPPLISQDGSHVYFFSTSVLTATPNGVGEAAEGGANMDNLYVYERDASYPEGRIEFVARLAREDVSGDPGEKSATPNGDFLVFASERPLTPDTTNNPHVRQLFEYDAQTGALVRVSIGENGFNNDGNVGPVYEYPGGTFPENIVDSAHIVPVPEYTYIYSSEQYSTAQSISANGSYVFFESTAGLTPQAIDRKVIGFQHSAVCNGSFELGEPCAQEGSPVYGNNVYEYHDGQVSLISDGQDLTTHVRSTSVELVGTDESGDDVFFKTDDRLAGQDTDTAVDTYDARIDGGFPAPAVPPSCSGESCQGALSGAPTLLSPGSEFQAGGNPPLSGETGRPTAKSTQCKRGYVKKQGKCVKAKAKKVKAKAKKAKKKASNKRRVKS
jgi:hypothetical protein